MTSLRRATGGGVALAVIMLLGNAHAAFISIDDFDALDLGPIDAQNGWRAPSENSAVVSDPAGGTNQVLQIVTESTRVHHEALIDNETVRMLFLRFRYDDQLNFSLGTSSSTNPDQFGEFETEMNMSNASSEFRINDDGFYTVLTVLEPMTWYNLWLLIDNDDDVTSAWLHARPGEPALAADQLSAEGLKAFAFRDGAAGDMRTFYVKTGGGSGVLGPLYLDDIYLEDTSAQNLANPASHPTGVAPLPRVMPSLGVHPNPFNPRTTVTFDLPSEQHAEVTIHDLAGRAIVVLTAQNHPSGEHSVAWNGRDRAGLDVPSGVYLVRLRTAAGIQARKVLLAR